MSRWCMRSLWGIWILTMNLAAQQSVISVSAAVDKNEITVGDRIQYTLSISHDLQIEVNEPGQMKKIGELDVLALQVQPPTEKEGQRLLTFVYTITAFDTGAFTIPAFPIAWRDSAQASFQFADSPSLQVVVLSVLEEDLELRDIRPPLGLSPDWSRHILIGLLLILLLALAYYLWRKWQKREIPEVIRRKEVIRPAHLTALEALDDLENSNLLDLGEYKAYFTNLSDIIRHYLEERFYIKAMEETTSELLLSLKEGSLSDEAINLLKGILHNCDLVKFARFQPGIPESQNTLNYCREFIESTRLDFETVEREIVEKKVNTGEVEK